MSLSSTMSKYRLRCSVPTCEGKQTTRHSIPRSPLCLHQEWLRRIQNDRMKNLTSDQIWKRYRICGIHFTDANRIQDLNRLRKYSVPSLYLPGFENGDLSEFFTNKEAEDQRAIKKCCVPNCKDLKSVRHHIPKDPYGYHLEFVRRIQNDQLKNLSPAQIGAEYFICDIHFSVVNKFSKICCLRRFSLPTLFLPDGLKSETLSAVYEASEEKKNDLEEDLLNSFRQETIPSIPKKITYCSIPKCIGHAIKHCIPYGPLIYHQEWVRRIKNDLMNGLSTMEICDLFYVCDRHFSDAVKTEDQTCLKPFSLPTLHLSNSSAEQLSDFFPEELLFKSGNDHQSIKNTFKTGDTVKKAETLNSDDEDDCFHYWIVITA